MPRYYFHLEDAESTLDAQGTELADIDAVRKEAVMILRDLLKGKDPASEFWSGIATWRIWVTNLPNGQGDTLVSLQLTASLDWAAN